MTAELDPVARIQALAATFPSLAVASGVTPWDPAALDEWATTRAAHRAAVRAWLDAPFWLCDPRWLAALGPRGGKR